MNTLPRSAALLSLTLGLVAMATGQTGTQTVVFEQKGFPSVDCESIAHDSLVAAFSSPNFTDIAGLRSGSALQNAGLLVLPYGSAFPAEAWPAIQTFVQHGGHLLLIGGQPMSVPVIADQAGFTRRASQDTYRRSLGFQHSYPVPDTPGPLHFAWRPGYEFLPPIQVAATQIYAQEGRLQGLGYLDASDGTHRAAPVIVLDRTRRGANASSRIVALPFTPSPGYFSTKDGIQLLRTAAEYALGSPADFRLEAHYSTLRPGEAPELKLHLAHSNNQSNGSFAVTLKSGLKTLDTLETLTLAAETSTTETPLTLHHAIPSGVYTVNATWTPANATHPQEFATNGFVVEDLAELSQGEALGVSGDFLTLANKPFFPVGTNYFSTEENGWDFSGPRNAAVWETDFADMQRHGVTFVRTGVWIGVAKLLDPATGQVTERFLRNLEAFLSAAHRHNIVVNFTFFAFTPRFVEASKSAEPAPLPANPYLNPDQVLAEQTYIASIVQRFSKLPWLSYDLINEPSFSNPATIFHGNVPNGDPAELAAWQSWLKARYADLPALADAWRTSPASLVSWESIPLPAQADLSYNRFGNDRQVRAVDYNSFAQASFSGWVVKMISAIRAAGSAQLVNVGQDEGGVTDRVLNQFYATSGVAFTTNHTYWQDDALLWDAVAAKRPGMPNIVGETGYQPAWDADGTWRTDELTAAAIEERKWALGFAAGSSGAVQWDWAREVDLGMQRSDGSAKIFEDSMTEMGAFARQAAPFATSLALPQVALFLPQSLQLSSRNNQALKAQQAAVRALYHYSRAEAYAVGEYQMDTLGTPRLILLPSAFGLSAEAWKALEARVRTGSVLLISGPFNGDEHMHPTTRAATLGIPATLAPLQLRHEALHMPSAVLPLQYDGQSTTSLDRDRLPGGEDWKELPLGKGRILYSALPLELNANLASVAAVYDYALALAHVQPTYKTSVKDPGILICPTRLAHATLYVLTSETSTTAVDFTDQRSGKTFSGQLQAGRAALLLVGEHGELLAQYRWHATH